MIRKSVDVVMNPYKNALQHLPKIVRFQLMVTLSFFWSIIFCLSAGVFVWLPAYVGVHVVLLLIGIFGTGWLFDSAQTKSAKMSADTKSTVSGRKASMY